DYRRAELETAGVTAYLAEPISTAPLRSKPGPKYASYTVESAVEHKAVIKSLSDDPMRRFKIAIHALGLARPHTTIVKEIPHWIKDTGSEEEDSDDYEVEVTERAVCGGSIESRGDATPTEEMATNVDSASEEHPLLAKPATSDESKSTSNESHSREIETSSGVDGCTGSDSDVDDNWFYAPKLQNYCIDCGEEPCQGCGRPWQMAIEPRMMMLGCGELRAYAVVD
ncbi:MAG: hypothetical protein Q9174_006960, partial [Haloplaca sp. 1 TL-2023]